MKSARRTERKRMKKKKKGGIEKDKWRVLNRAIGKKKKKEGVGESYKRSNKEGEKKERQRKRNK